MADNSDQKESRSLRENIDKLLTNKKPSMTKSPSYTLALRTTMVPTPIVSMTSSKRSVSLSTSPPPSPASREKRAQESLAANASDQSTPQVTPLSQPPSTVPLPPPLVLPPDSEKNKKENADNKLPDLPPPPVPISDLPNLNKVLTSSAPALVNNKNSPIKKVSVQWQMTPPTTRQSATKRRAGLKRSTSISADSSQHAISGHRQSITSNMGPPNIVTTSPKIHKPSASTTNRLSPIVISTSQPLARRLKPRANKSAEDLALSEGEGSTNTNDSKGSDESDTSETEDVIETTTNDSEALSGTYTSNSSAEVAEVHKNAENAVDSNETNKEDDEGTAITLQIIELQNKIEKLTKQCAELKEKVALLEKSIEESDRPKLEAIKLAIVNKENEIEKLTKQKTELEETEKNIAKNQEVKSPDTTKKNIFLRKKRSQRKVNNKPKRDLVIRVENNKKFVRGGSVVELLNAACRNLYGDSDFQETFVLTYSTFMTQEQLFDMIVERYKIAQESSNLAESEPIPRKNKIRVFQRRQVLSLFRLWVVLCPHDFVKLNNIDFYNKVFQFATQTFEETKSPIAQDILDYLTGKKEKQIADPYIMSPKPSTKALKSFDLMEYGEKDFARQLVCGVLTDIHLFLVTHTHSNPIQFVFSVTHLPVVHFPY
jgi:regulator of replication initiation timing